MFGYLPPPHFGPSTAYQALMNSEFSRRFDVTFVNLSMVRDLRELEQFRIGKVLKLCRFALQEIFHLLKHRFDYCCYPVSFNRNAFLKDAVLLGLARVFGVPTVLWAHGNNLPDFHERSPRWVQWLIDRTISRAAAGIVLGERLRFNFERWLPPEKIFVAPIGVEPVEPAPLRASSGGDINVLYLGNLIREKGVFVLLEAATLITRERSDVRFTFAGNWFRAQDEAAAKEFVAAHRLDSHVAFIGPVTSRAKWQTLADADILAFPTYYYYETMGLVLLEAMQAGVPVVTTRRASIPEIVRDGEHGLLVNEQDAADLAAKIVRLADDDGLRKRMGKAGRERFANYYTHMHYGQRMIQVFEALGTRESVSQNTQDNPPQQARRLPPVTNRDRDKH